MLINDLIALLMQIPPMLAAQWGVWFAVGLGLSIWGRREKARLVFHGHDNDSAPRPKSGVRPPARQVKSVPHSSGDAFAELEALLEEQEGKHRTPGEAPSAPSSNEPLRSAPVLAAPQSLP